MAVNSIIPMLKWTSIRERNTFIGEVLKSGLVLGYAISCWIFTSFMIMIVDQTLPDLELHGFGLPDVFFEYFEYKSSYVELSEIAIQFLLLILILVVAFHKYRFVVLRRWALVCGTVFIGRAFCLWMTRLPVTAEHTKICYSLYEQGKLMSFWDNFKGALRITFAAGKQGENSGIATCGDLIYSGHCTIATSVVLTIWKYVRFENFTLRILQFATLFTLYFVGVYGLLVSRTHYTVDVVLAMMIVYLYFSYFHLHVERKRRRGRKKYVEEYEPVDLKIRKRIEFESKKDGEDDDQDVENSTLLDFPLIPFFSFFEGGEVVKSDFQMPWKCIPLTVFQGSQQKISN